MASMIGCRACGASMKPEALACPKCGTPSHVLAQPVTGRLSPAAWFCLTCEQFGEPRRVTNGSFFIELILWLCFLVPGLIYSIWRLTTRHNACPHCGATTLVPQSAPRARAALAKTIG